MRHEVGSTRTTAEFERSNDSTTIKFAEVMKPVARPTPYDNDQRIGWNSVSSSKTHSCEREVRTASTRQNVTAGNDETSVLIRTLSHTLYAGDTNHGTKFETGTTSAKQKRVRSLETVGVGERTKDSGSKIRDVARCVSDRYGCQSGKVRRNSKSVGTPSEVCEKLADSKLDDDVKISVVLCEAPPKLLENPQQFQSNYNKLRAIIQAYLNSNKRWIANDFRETDPMDVDYIGKSKGKNSHFARDWWSRSHQDTRMGVDAAKESVFTIETRSMM